MKHLKWLIPLLFLAAIAPFTPAIDLHISSLFFTPSPIGGKGVFYNNPFFHFLFRYGELFGFAFGGFAGFVFILSFFIPKWKKWRPGSLAIGLTLFIGAGLITNAFFKEYWGRPRPKEIVEFGGKHIYRPFWSPDFSLRQKSFPSGHVAMGFYYLSLCFAAKRYRNRFLLYSGIFLTVFWGVGLMAARVAQGGHFLSDVIASALLMWLVALSVDHWVWKARKVSELSKNQ